MIGEQGNHMVGDESEYWKEPESIQSKQEQKLPCCECSVIIQSEDLIYVKNKWLCPECIENPKHVH